MNWRTYKLRIITALALVAMAAVTPALARDEGKFERTLKVTGPVDLEIETGSGSIHVHAGASDTVEVRGVIHAHRGWHFGKGDPEERIRAIEANPPIEQEGNTIHIGRFEDSEMTSDISISYELIVPEETKLRSQTGSGSQKLEGIRGPVETTTGSGSLRATNIGGEVRARTGSGDVELESVKGSIRASAGSGSIHAVGIAGGLVASTGSGDVKLQQTAAGDIEVETGSGSVELSGVKGAVRASTGSGEITAEGEPAGKWRLRTGSGTVTVRLPEQAAFEVVARTSSGHIETSHPITVKGTISPRELHGQVGAGGVLIEVSTSSGNINIE